MSGEPEEQVGSDYLWDKTGEPDVEIQRLEGVLARYRYRPEGRAEPRARAEDLVGEPPHLAPAREDRRRVRRILVGAIAASLVAALVLWSLRPERESPANGYRLIGWAGRDLVRAGEELLTSDATTIEIGRLGHVDVERGSKIRVEDTGAEAHRLFLAKGRVSAKISAEPRVFQIGTPSGAAIDLGCAYELAVDDAGAAKLSVTDGQVAFDFDGREVYVPEGASCVSTPGGGPQVPMFDDADEGFREAVRAVEHAKDPDPEALSRALTIDRREDGLTLWHLFTSDTTSEPVRLGAYASLARIFPMPQGVTEEGVLAGDEAMRAKWVERMKWSWR